MRLKSFRERVLAKADALTERADRMQAELDAEAASRVSGAEAARVDAVRAWHEERAEAFGESHDDLVARAERFGLPLPEPHKADVFEQFAGINARIAGVIPGGTVLGAVGATAAGVESNYHQSSDPYMAWVNLIRAEERCAEYTDAGQKPPLVHRTVLKGCRVAFKHS